MISDEELAARVRAICETADLNTLTERQVRNLLVQALGDEQFVKSKAKLISQSITVFLDELAGAQPADDEDYNPAQGEQGDAGDDDDEYEPSEDEEAGTSKSRKRKGAVDAEGSTIKKPRVEANQYILPLSSKKRLTVRDFKGKAMIDIRENYVDKATGEEKPGSKGISLSLNEWHKLWPELPALQAALESEQEGKMVHLTDMRRAYVAAYKGTYSVHLREFYQPAEGGEQKPGKKGVTLSDEDMQTIQEHVQAINQHCGKLGGGFESKQASQAAQTSKSDVRQQQSQQVERNYQHGEDPLVIDLGGNKRVTKSDFKGGNWVDMREYYSKDGKLLPGKKGIMLKVDEWRKIANACSDITAAVTRKDLSYCLQLAPKRKVTLSIFNGKLYVGVREFYEKDGKEAPGQKGLSMNEEQWSKLAQHAAAFTSAL